MIRNFSLAIHGGAGTILKKNMTREAEKIYKESLVEALEKGFDILKNGGTSLDAVEVTVKVLEDNPLFNAGKGSVFTSDGKNEMDAAIMEGSTLAAGAVAQVTNIKNPISAARAVMEKSEHIMMVGKGAEQFAQLYGLQIVDPSYFFTLERWDALQRVRAEDPSKTELDHDNREQVKIAIQSQKIGTVGAVAIDLEGKLASASSTGGMTNKKFGRVGDSAIVGAGIYANRECAISCTGWGEFFMRLCVAKTVCDLVEYKKYSLKKAATEVIMKQLPALGGDGGLIAVDSKANVVMPFSTEGMYRGFIKNNGKAVVDIYTDRLK
ncbi:MAG: isoaspartyl peptidase/L-asparaginase family protein [Candidatus Dadabacteria bacterium]